MNHKIQLSKKEEELIEEDSKRVIIRPQRDEFAKIAKGDELDCGDLRLLVLSVRDYPRIEDLLRLENFDWLVLDFKDITDAIKEVSDEYKEEVESKIKFLAIEFAVQE
jgi:ASC-1-like (ASCH) protein